MDTTLSNIDFAPLSEVKAKLSEKIASTVEKGRLLVITINGKPKAVLVSYAEFLKTMERGPEVTKHISLEEWKKESRTRREISSSIKSLFDLSKLSRKGQKPYKANALKKFKK